MSILGEQFKAQMARKMAESRAQSKDKRQWDIEYKLTGLFILRPLRWFLTGKGCFVNVIRIAVFGYVLYECC